MRNRHWLEYDFVSLFGQSVRNDVTREIALLHQPDFEMVVPCAPPILIIAREHQPLRSLLKLNDAIKQIGGHITLPCLFPSGRPAAVSPWRNLPQEPRLVGGPPTCRPRARRCCPALMGARSSLRAVAYPPKEMSGGYSENLCAKRVAAPAAGRKCFV